MVHRTFVGQNLLVIEAVDLVTSEDEQRELDGLPILVNYTEFVEPNAMHFNSLPAALLGLSAAWPFVESFYAVNFAHGIVAVQRLQNYTTDVNGKVSKHTVMSDPCTINEMSCDTSSLRLQVKQ